MTTPQSFREIECENLGRLIDNWLHEGENGALSPLSDGEETSLKNCLYRYLTASHERLIERVRGDIKKIKRSTEHNVCDNYSCSAHNVLNEVLDLLSKIEGMGE